MSLSNFKLMASSLIRMPIQAFWKSVLSYDGKTIYRHFSAPASEKAQTDQHLINRNPRNLELMGIAWRRKGWKFHYPPKEFYHRVVLERTNRHTTAYVEHSSGLRVVSASTKEIAITRHLFSPVDVSAAENIGRILARRCQECGITSMVPFLGDNYEQSEKYQSFQKALLEGGIDLSEPEEVVPDYEPGIAYDNEEEVNNLFERQQLVFKLGTRHQMLKDLNQKYRSMKGRRRPFPRPSRLVAPAYTFT